MYLGAGTQYIPVYIYHGFVRGIVWLQVIRDGIPQLVSIVPFAYYWYYVGAPTSYYILSVSIIPFFLLSKVLGKLS